MRTFPVLAAIALLATAGPATAGPIYWNYHLAVEYAQDYGPKFEVNLAQDWFVRGLPGVPAGIWLFNSNVPARPEPGSHEVTYSFAIRVTITDEASGEFATFSFPGFYSSVWSYPPQDRDNPDRWRLDSEAAGFGDDQKESSVTLGDHVYVVQAHSNGPGRYPDGVMLVDLDPSAITPEPGTLALAGVGFGAVGLLRARRRRAESSDSVC
ncbi:MAG TPA: PEP-CTERM sorting domain-containing protein [Gemmataceae bacterium]|nr:PEP-CTERM sorting domain-containing protein [Gemmataceae bacterium]